MSSKNKRIDVIASMRKISRYFHRAVIVTNHTESYLGCSIFYSCATVKCVHKLFMNVSDSSDVAAPLPVLFAAQSNLKFTTNFQRKVVFEIEIMHFLF